MLKSRIKNKCLEIIEEKGWGTFDDISVDIMDEDVLPFLFYMNLIDRTINIRVCKDWNDKIIKFTEDKKIRFSPKEVENSILYSAVIHEYGHHKYCPRTKEGFEKIVDGAYETLEELDSNRKRIISFCSNIMNLFSDTILNTITSHTDTNKEKFRIGYYFLQLFSASYNKYLREEFSPIKLFKKKMDKGMSLFCSSNFILCDIPTEYSEKINKYYAAFFVEYQPVIEKIIRIFSGDAEIAKDILSKKKNASAILNRIQDMSLWKQMTVEYTRVLFPYMKREYEEQKSSFTKFMKDNLPSQGASSSKTENRTENNDEKNNEKDPNGKKDENDTNGRTSQEKNYDDKETIKNYLAKLEADKQGIPYSSPFLMEFWRLDDLYRKRAGRLSILASDETRPASKYEYMYGSEPISLDEFDHRNIEWSSTRCIKDIKGRKNIKIFKRNLNLDMEFDGPEISPGGIPDIAFVFDSSSSMEFKPNEGIGEYHFAVLAFYSILHDLEQKNLAHIINYSAINFSEKTIYSGWKEYSEINYIKKAIFDYQGSYTKLDPNVLSDLRTGRKSSFIVFMLSDLGFNFKNNENLVYDQMILMSKLGVGFFIFQLGGVNSFSTRLMRDGIPIYNIRTAEDFLNKSVEFTKELYGCVSEV